MNRKELEKKAKKLGIDFDEDTEDDELQELVEEAEEKAKKDKDTKDPNERISYLESELEKAISRRDKAVKDRRNLSKKIKELEDNYDNLPSSDEISQLKKDLKALRDFKKEKEKEEEEKELENATELEKVKISMQKQIDLLSAEKENLEEKLNEATQETETKLEKATETINKLRKRTLESDIVNAASKFNAFKPHQIVKLVKSDFVYNEDTGEFVHEKYTTNKGEKKYQGELTVEEYVKEFLSDEDNENLVRSPAKNSFHSDKHKKPDDKSDKKNKDKDSKNASDEDLGDFDPEDPEIVRKADLEDMTPERYIKVVLQPQAKAKERLNGTKESDE